MGNIFQPATRTFHSRPMPDDLFRVRLLRVLPGHDNVLPPIQPIQEEDDPETLVLHQCYRYHMQCPNS